MKLLDKIFSYFMKRYLKQTKCQNGFDEFIRCLVDRAKTIGCVCHTKID